MEKVTIVNRKTGEKKLVSQNTAKNTALLASMDYVIQDLKPTKEAPLLKTTAEYSAPTEVEAEVIIEPQTEKPKADAARPRQAKGGKTATKTN